MKKIIGVFISLFLLLAIITFLGGYLPYAGAYNKLRTADCLIAEVQGEEVTYKLKLDTDIFVYKEVHDVKTEKYMTLIRQEDDGIYRKYTNNDYDTQGMEVARNGNEFSDYWMGVINVPSPSELNVTFFQGQKCWSTARIFEVLFSKDESLLLENYKFVYLNEDGNIDKIDDYKRHITFQYDDFDPYVIDALQRFKQQV